MWELRPAKTIKEPGRIIYKPPFTILFSDREKIVCNTWLEAKAELKKYLDEQDRKLGRK